MKWMTLLFFILISGHAKAESCRAFLGPSVLAATESVTENFIAMLSTLIEQHKLPAEYLQILITDINQQKPITNIFKTSQFNSDQIVFDDIFQQYIDHQDLNKKQLQEWAQRTLSKLRKTKAEKNEVKNNNEKANIKMTFYEIKGGDFLLDDKYPNKVESFELMNTPVTQWMWASLQQLMGSNEAHIIWPSDNIGLVKGFPTHLDHPVENVTWDACKHFVPLFC